MTLSPTADEIDSIVDPDRLARLVGYPAGVPLAGPALALAEEARSWYARCGGPWMRARSLPILEYGGGRVRLAEGLVLSSPLLASRLRRCRPREMVIAAVSAGTAIDGRVDSLWADQRPDEAYVLDRYGAAVTESLAAGVARDLRHRVASRGFSVLPAMSPGCEDWPLTDQVVLVEGLLGTEKPAAGEELVALESGALSPRSSMLAVLAIAERLPNAWERVEACSWCSLAACGMRRDLTVAVAGGAR